MSYSVKVSVIVPVFNGEKYLSKSLDSICAQTLKEIEIICVDDGSSDSTPEILADYAGKDERIRIIRQDNMGPGPARSTGLSEAVGKYLVFWDSDDWFYPEALEKMFLKCEEDNAEICVCDGYTYFEDSEKEIPSSIYLRTSLLPEQLPFNRNDIPDHILDFTVATLWNKMFLRSFTEENGLTFKDYWIGEDSNFSIKALCLAERITAADERLICYRSGQQESLSMKWIEGRTPIEAFCDTADFLKERGIMPERSFANKALSNMLSMLRKAASVWEVFSKAVDILKGGALERMCVTEREEGYYFEQWKADCLHHLLNDSKEDFLCFYLRVTFMKLSQATGQLRSASEKISDLKTESGDLKEKIGVLRDQRKEIGDKLKEAESRNASLEKESTLLNNRLAGAEERIGRLTEKTEELRGVRKELSDKLTASEKQVEKLNAKTEELRGVRKELTNKLNASEKQVEKLNAKTEELRNIRKELSDSLKASEKHNEKLIAKTEALREQRKEQGELLQQARKNNLALREQNDSLREQNRKLKESMSYKIGRVITWLPRKIKGLFRKK